MLDKIFKILGFLFLAFGVCGICYFGKKMLFGSGEPFAIYPEIIDIGEQCSGSVAVAKATIYNNGTASLNISNVSSSCGCLSIDYNNNGIYEKITKKSIPPKGTLEMRFRVSVAGKPGFEQVIFAGFLTNENKMPFKKIQLTIPKITGGIWPEPLHLIFDEIATGKIIQKTIFVYNNNIKGRKIYAVKSSNSEILGVEIKELDKDKAYKNHEFAGELIGIISVKINANRPQRICEFIEVFLNDLPDKPEKIEVFGHVGSCLKTDQDVLVLNINNKGDVLPFDPITISYKNIKIQSAKVKSKPGGLYVDLIDDRKKSIFLLCKIILDKNFFDLNSDLLFDIVVTVTDNEGFDHLLEIPVVIRRY